MVKIGSCLVFFNHIACTRSRQYRYYWGDDGVISLQSTLESSCLHGGTTLFIPTAVCRWLTEFVAGVLSQGEAYAVVWTSDKIQPPALKMRPEQDNNTKCFLYTVMDHNVEGQ